MTEANEPPIQDSPTPSNPIDLLGKARLPLSIIATALATSFTTIFFTGVIWSDFKDLPEIVSRLDRNTLYLCMAIHTTETEIKKVIQCSDNGKISLVYNRISQLQSAEARQIATSLLQAQIYEHPDLPTTHNSLSRNVSGVVFDANSGKPLQNAQIYPAVTTNDLYSVRTNNEGLFTFFIPDYALEAWQAAGGQSIIQAIVKAPNYDGNLVEIDLSSAEPLFIPIK